MHRDKYSMISSVEAGLLWQQRLTRARAFLLITAAFFSGAAPRVTPASPPRRWPNQHQRPPFLDFFNTATAQRRAWVIVCLMRHVKGVVSLTRLAHSLEKKGGWRESQTYKNAAARLGRLRRRSEASSSSSSSPQENSSSKKKRVRLCAKKGHTYIRSESKREGTPRTKDERNMFGETAC